MNADEVHLSLFGTPRLHSAGCRVPLPVRKTLALLVYLALEGRSTREHLAGLFWATLDDATARRNLRRAVHRLRAAGLQAHLLASDDELALHNISHDLQRFDAALAAGRLDQAHAMRTGVLLDGLALPEATAFNDWLSARREQFMRRWQLAMAQHARQLEISGQPQASLELQRQLLDDDPLQEALYRDLMRLHDALGERAAALEVFARCERLLRDELALAPLPQTCRLAEQIRARQAPTLARDEADTAPTPVVAWRDPGLLARERELAALATWPGALVLIEGDAGVGKSRLAFEALQARAMSPDQPHTLLHVRCTELSQSTPFYAVADALRMVSARHCIEPLAMHWKRELQRLLPELKCAPGDGADAPPPDPSEARARLLEALAQALALAAGSSRTVLVDDLQWADASTLELLAHMVRRHAQAPLQMARVLATARTAELAANPHAASLLRSLADSGALQRLALQPFDDPAMLQLVQRSSGRRGGVRFAARLKAATGGNVFFALQCLRALLDAGELLPDPVEGWRTRYDDTTTGHADLPMPANVAEALRERVARLGPAVQRLLETAALAEQGSSLAEILGGTALTDWEAVEAIERAVAARVLEASGSGYRFVHALFRAALCAGMSPERQRLIHAKLAATLEPLHAAPERVAAHWEQAGQSEAAAAAWVRAAESATTVLAHHEAIAHYGRAAALTADVGQAFELHDLRLWRMLTAGLHSQCSEPLSQMQALAERSGVAGLMFRALMRAAEVAAHERRMVLCEELALRALREFEPPDARRHAGALSCAAFAAQHLGRYADALARWTEVVAVAQRGLPQQLANASSSAAAAAVALDRIEQAQAFRALALQASAAQPQSLERANALCKCSFVPRALGQRTLALAEMAQALAIVQRMRLTSFAQFYLANQCEVLLDDGQPEAALAVQRACAASFADPALPLARFMLSMTAAPLHAAHGELGAAISAARSAIAVADEIDNLPDRRDARLVCAGLLAQVGALDQALRLAVQAQALLPREPGQRLLPAENLHAEAELALHPAAAHQRLLQALAAPFADRLLHPHLGAARVLLGRCELAEGRPDAARAAVKGLCYSVALEAQALALRLAANEADGQVDPTLIAETQALLGSGRVPPLQALELMQGLAATRAGRGSGQRKALQAGMRGLAQTLADSLQADLPLQACFIRKHRQLLTRA